MHTMTVPLGCMQRSVLSMQLFQSLTVASDQACTDIEYGHFCSSSAAAEQSHHSQHHGLRSVRCTFTSELRIVIEAETMYLQPTRPRAYLQEGPYHLY